MMPRLQARALDNVSRRAHGALDKLPANPPSCGHLVDGGLAYLCAHHPADGLRCTPCADRHGAGHPIAVENSCDGCGAIEPLVWPTFALAGARLVGRTRVRVIVLTLGYCDRCRPRAGGSIARGAG